MDNIEREVILALGAGPKTVRWLSLELNMSPIRVGTALVRAELAGFAEPRGIEFLYPQTDRRDGVRRKRGKRLKTWTATRQYFALTAVGRVLLPLDGILIGAK